VNACPCGSNSSYQLCCGQYHHDLMIAKTPEILMRSRYTAYVMGDMAYIKKTMRGKPLEGFNDAEVNDWIKSICWLGLNVIKSKDDGLNKHETSEFQREDNFWYYVDGKEINIPSLKILPNSTCPCGSKRKFKHCKHEDNRAATIRE
jgi:SEC-C motif-containing protein